MAYVSFFPQLVAGPIERATRLLPQFLELKKFDYQTMRASLLLIAWGLVKKIVIADRLAVFVNGVYTDVNGVKGLPLIVAVLFFAFQLYLDFSAYSDIARGSGQLLGFHLMVNFRRPYLSASFSEFWKRWHISLSSWFMDYVYIPLGGNRRGSRHTMINLMVVFLLSGLWHGASWNFVIWGAMNGLFLIIFDRVLQLKKPASGIKRMVAPLVITLSWAFSLIFFRAQTFADAVTVFANLGWEGADTLYQYGLSASELKFSFYLLVGYMIVELILEKWDESIDTWFYARPFILRWAVYLVLVLSIVYLGSYGSGTDNTFIYFQF